MPEAQLPTTFILLIIYSPYVLKDFVELYNIISMIHAAFFLLVYNCTAQACVLLRAIPIN